MTSPATPPATTGLEIAIIGMAGRFPGAADIAAFWQNLCDGVESISHFTRDELLAAGVAPALLDDPRYVPAMGALAGVELFDAAFFGISPREAQTLDPQHRLFLECAWAALEDAGYPAGGPVGVYAGTSKNSYLLHHLLPHPALMEAAGPFQVMINNDKDYLTTRVSYKLNLEGPSIAVQTACSTALVAVYLAVQGLLSGDCRMALAGGVTITLPQQSGYLYQEGGIAASDGHCRAFDAQATGTVPGNGVGLVVLKRLEDALEDGDQIYAVIKGAAINNDGGRKAGYTAPRADGQAAVIRAAQLLGEVEPATLGYIECHGTGTPLGDPIELAALREVFGPADGPPCAIGSVKTNIGHLDAAAGVAGLIKATLALRSGMIPPSLHYSTPNPQLHLEQSPFFVNTTLAPWPQQAGPRRAGVSAFGIGGTNAHVVLEQAPAQPSSPSAWPQHLLLLSAHSAAALEAQTDNLARRLQEQGAPALADAAYTLQAGRTHLTHRRVLVASDSADAAQALGQRSAPRLLSAVHTGGTRPVAFLFPGQGAQYAGMGQALYDLPGPFRTTVDQCTELLRPHLPLDLRALLFRQPGAPDDTSAQPSIDQTQYAQPALFTIAYALAQLWLHWGVQPAALIGHSVGEYVAACLAGVFTLEHALTLVAARGRLLQQLPPGAMLSVALDEPSLRALLPPGLDLAAVNGPELCVVAGPRPAVEALRAALVAQGRECRMLHTSHAFHSAMLEPALEPYARLVAQLPLHPPSLPFISNLSGGWISDAQATDPAYWVRHLREPVRFADGLAELLREPGQILLEIGPGRTLSTLARRNPAAAGATVLHSLPDARQATPDTTVLLQALGQVWLAGGRCRPAQVYRDERRQRVSLPSYPFERQRHWVEPGSALPTAPRPPQEVGDWFSAPFWRPAAPLALAPLAASTGRWLVLTTQQGWSAAIASRLEQLGQSVVRVQPGAQFAKHDSHSFTIEPHSPRDYSALLDALAAGGPLGQVLHLWGLDHAPSEQPPAWAAGLSSVLLLAQALARRTSTPLRYAVIGQRMHANGDTPLDPARASIPAVCTVIAQEQPLIGCQSIDIERPAADRPPTAQQIDQLLAEIMAPQPERAVCYRGNQRWTRDYAALPAAPAKPWRTGGAYLVTGGLAEGMDALLAPLASSPAVQLALIEPQPLPAPAEWDDWLATHPAAEPTSQRIRQAQALAAQGATLLLLQADLSDPDALAAACTQAMERFGPLHGVIHAAPFARRPALAPFEELRQADWEQELARCTGELEILTHQLRGQPLDFCVLLSSLSTLLGGLGCALEAATLCLLDRWAEQHQQAGQPWLSIDWDVWRRDEPPSGAAPGLGIARQQLGEALCRAVGLGYGGQLLVSTGDLRARAARWVALEQRSAAAPQPGSTPGSGQRPDLSNPYVAATNPIEAQLVTIWQELLGIQPIGIHDDFFALGGHSLLATTLMTRLRAAFQTELALRTIFESPTIAGLTVVVAQHQAAQVDHDRLAQLLNDIKQLSPRELDDLLAAERQVSETAP